MKSNKNLFLTALTLVTFSAGAWAQAVSSPDQPPVTATDIQELREALAAQQRQIQALQLQLQSKEQALAPAPRETPSAATPAASEPSDSSAAVATNLQAKPADKSSQNAGSSDERIRNLERQIKGIGPISFSGDVRLRAEPFFGGPSDESLERMRGRIRARFNAIANLGEQFRAGLTLASGDINDPTSTNQNLTGFYSRKAVALDQAFVEFTPKQFKNLTVVGGT